MRINAQGGRGHVRRANTEHKSGLSTSLVLLERQCASPHRLYNLVFQPCLLSKNLFYVSRFWCSTASRRRRRRKPRRRLLWSRPPRAASPAPRRRCPPAAATRRKRRASWIRSWNSSPPRWWICSIKSNSVSGETQSASHKTLIRPRLTPPVTSAPRPPLHRPHPAYPPPTTSKCPQVEQHAVNFPLHVKHQICDGATLRSPVSLQGESYDMFSQTVTRLE